jgi:serine/threonine protein kinase
MSPDGVAQTFQVAVKSLTLPKERKADEIMQELMIQMKLDDCPCVCKCYGYYNDQDKVNIVMELLERDLEKDIKARAGSREAFREEELLGMLWQVTYALAFAQRKNIAHRDIKPQNILLNSVEFVKLVDFGSGAVADGKMEKLTGTPLYMSPELLPILRHFQATGIILQTDTNPYKSDVYSLGLTFMSAAMCAAPVQLMHEAGRAAALSGYMQAVQGGYPRLGNLLNWMLVDDPAGRIDFNGIIAHLRGLIPPPSMLASSELANQPPIPFPDEWQRSQTFSQSTIPSDSIACANCGQPKAPADLIRCSSRPESQVCQECYLQWTCEACGLYNESFYNRTMDRQFVICQICHALRAWS